MEPELARALWHHLEAVNAVTYFCPECRDAPSRLGLEGFWMGYFASRAAPMGEVGAGVVEAVFFNFHPARVRRAIPRAWELVGAPEVLAARAGAAADALRRLLPRGLAGELAHELLPALGEAIERATPAGRPLFVANRDVPTPDDPVAALWQAATTLREHRGDGHVALLTGAGLDGCEVHVLFAASEGVGAELYLQSRGWSVDDWRAAIGRLASRGLVTDSGATTVEGRDLRDEVERRTDELAILPYATLGAERVEHLLRLLPRASGPIISSGEILFPNPMGLPEPTATS